MGLLAASLAAGLLIHWGAAVALLVLGLGILHRPLELFLTWVLVAGAATFVINEGGHLTRDLSLVTAMCLYGLFCLQLYAATGRWGLPLSKLTIALIALGVTTAGALATGILAHNSPKLIGLELYPILAFFTALVVGGVRIKLKELRLGLGVLITVALGHVVLGLSAYVINRVRTGGTSFTGIPGMVALLVLNLALRSESRRLRILSLLLMGLLLFHQLISFTRGYWLALLASIPFSCILYGGRGPGSARRWGRVGKMVAATALIVIAGVMTFGYWFGWSDILAMVVKRFASSLTVRNTGDAASNIARLVEYGASMRYIAAAPWLGHGLGFSLLVQQPVYGITTSQWYVHESYLLMWLKQGIVGLLALLALLFVGVRVGTRGALKLSGEAAGWSAAAASCTVFLAVHALTNFTFGSVNGNFLIALLWGIALSVARPRRVSFA